MRRILTLALLLATLAGCRAQTMTSLPVLPGSLLDTNVITFAVQPASATQTYKMKLGQIQRLLSAVQAGNGLHVDSGKLCLGTPGFGNLTNDVTLSAGAHVINIGGIFSPTMGQSLSINNKPGGLPGVFANTPRGYFIAGDITGGVLGHNTQLIVDDSTGYYQFSRLRNNLAGDSILTTDTAGHLLLRKPAAAWVDDGTRIYQADTTHRVGIGTTRPHYSLQVNGSTFLNKPLPNGLYAQFIMDTNILGYPIHATAVQYGTADGSIASYWDIGDYRGIGRKNFQYDLGFANVISGRTFELSGDSTQLRIFSQDYYGSDAQSYYFMPKGLGIGTANPTALLHIKLAGHRALIADSVSHLTLSVDPSMSADIPGIALNTPNLNFAAGDMDASGSGTQFTVQDAAQTITATTDSLVLNLDHTTPVPGTVLGCVNVNGHMSLVTASALLAALPSYSSNAAALAASLVAGDSYYNTTDKVYTRVF